MRVTARRVAARRTNKRRVNARRRTTGCTATFGAVCLALVATSCSIGDPTATAEESSGGSGSVEQLCATFTQWQPAITAAGTDLGPLAEAKIGYLTAAQAAAPASWADNIAEILPVWQTLQQVLIEADGDATRINFERFQADFADSTANEIALETFVQARCGG